MKALMFHCMKYIPKLFGKQKYFNFYRIELSVRVDLRHVELGENIYKILNVRFNAFNDYTSALHYDKKTNQYYIEPQTFKYAVRKYKLLEHHQKKLYFKINRHHKVSLDINDVILHMERENQYTQSVEVVNTEGSTFHVTLKAQKFDNKEEMFASTAQTT